MEEKLDSKTKESIRKSFKEEKISNNNYNNARQVTEVQYDKGGKLDINKKSAVSESKKIIADKNKNRASINKQELKKESKSDKKISRGKKTEAIVKGEDLRISTKQAVAVCNFIRNKEVDNAIKNLEQVKSFKKPVPMKGEIPHKKGVSIASGRGRYPINAVNEFLRLLKSLRANAVYNEMELEKFKIFCMANIASKPTKRFGKGRFKRSHVQIKLIPSVGGK